MKASNNKLLNVLFLGLLTILISFLLTPAAFCFTKGDINDDDKVGLPESIYALGVASNLRTTLTTSTLNVPGDFSTIQDAIDAASTGDTIVVASGVTSSPLAFRAKLGVALQGAGDGTNTITGIGVGPGPGSAVSIKDSFVKISGFAISNSDVGIYTTNSNVYCLNNAISGVTTGFNANDNSTVRIEGSQFTDNSNFGILITDSSAAYVTGCTSTGNGSVGIFVKSASSARAYNSIFSSNGGTGTSVRESSYGYFEDCTFEGNTRNGIFVGYSSSAGIAKNDITGNAQPGVNVSGGSTIESNGANLIHGNGTGDGPPGSHAGVYVYNGSFSIRYDSDLGDPDEIYDNTEGFRVEGFGVLNLTDYYIHGNSSDGILMSNYTMITFGPDTTNQTITDNGRFGLSYYSATSFGGPSTAIDNPDYGSGDTANTSGATYCWDCDESSCTGSWNRTENEITSGSGIFTFKYSFEGGGFSGEITLNDFYEPGIDMTIFVISENGIDFVPDPEIYGDNPFELTFTLSEGNISGSFVLSATVHHGEPEEEIIETEPSIITLNGGCN